MLRSTDELQSTINACFRLAPRPVARGLKQCASTENSLLEANAKANAKFFADSLSSDYGRRLLGSTCLLHFFI